MNHLIKNYPHNLSFPCSLHEKVQRTSVRISGVGGWVFVQGRGGCGGGGWGLGVGGRNDSMICLKCLALFRTHQVIISSQLFQENSTFLCLNSAVITSSQTGVISQATPRVYSPTSNIKYGYILFYLLSGPVRFMEDKGTCQT